MRDPLWIPSRRAERLNPSVIREILKVTERPGVLSMAGGLPSPQAFPVEAVRDATARVLAQAPHEALQYAPSEGYGPLREWIAARLGAQGWRVAPGQVLVTTGSQQGLDLVAKVMVEGGAPVAVEAPTYLGALQAFAPFEPRFVGVDCDDDGPLPQAIGRLAPGTRLLYLLPSFQNPGGRLVPEHRREAIVAAARAARVPLLEDDPYGELWYDAPPPRALGARWPEGTVHLGSFSKVLAPGLRVGWLVAPPALFTKLLQAKQATDLHTPGLNQRIAYEVVRDGRLDAHLPGVRALYAARRDAMHAALREHLPAGAAWRVPLGGMFFWVRLPAGCSATALLPSAVEAGIAYVPGEAFFAHAPDPRTMRLSFATLTPDEIHRAVGALGSLLRRHAPRAALEHAE